MSYSFEKHSLDSHKNDLKYFFLLSINYSFQKDSLDSHKNDIKYFIFTFFSLIIHFKRIV